jgi:hypothetical protein
MIAAIGSTPRLRRSCNVPEYAGIDVLQERQSIRGQSRDEASRPRSHNIRARIQPIGLVELAQVDHVVERVGKRVGLRSGHGRA